MVNKVLSASLVVIAITSTDVFASDDGSFKPRSMHPVQSALSISEPKPGTYGHDSCEGVKGRVVPATLTAAAALAYHIATTYGINVTPLPGKSNL